jgi:PIN domain nuclease of toxin-antitoxin system
VELGVVDCRPEIPWAAAAIVILLDTNALIWAEQGHARTRRLLAGGRRLYISPATLLELQFLHEAGKIRLRAAVQSIIDDHRWILDDPPAASWFVQALDLTWTRDPFDRLLVAHARLRGWRLATSDGNLVEQLGPAASIEL